MDNLQLKWSVPPDTDTQRPGYHGQYWRVDLDRLVVTAVSLPDALLRQVIGGSGLGTAILLAESAPDHAPLASSAPIVFAFSPLVGSPLTTSAKFAVVHRSPLTDRLNDSLVSSGFAIAGRRAGMDALVIVGRAVELSILVIDGQQLRLQTAVDLAGANCTRTATEVAERVGKDFRVAVIGPAGENLVRYATISHDGRHAGRGGAGAVLGSKNVKAIAVRGELYNSWANPAAVVELSKDLSRRSFGPATAKYRELGTAANLLTLNRLHSLPTRNFQSAQLDGAEQLSVESLRETHVRTRASCAACTIGCEHIYQLAGPSVDSAAGDSAGPTEVRVEYENLFALGSLCGISDSRIVLQACHLCDELGIDTISAGGTIAFAMEAYQRGLWTAAPLEFGNGQHLLEALERIGNRSGWGDWLADGSRELAHRLGGQSLDFAPQVKGLEMPGYEPRTLQAMALGLATNARGADHNRSGAYQIDLSERADRRQLGIDAVPLVIETEDHAALMDSLILCKFLRGVFADFAAEAATMLRSVTGWDIDATELMQAARGIVLLKKYFNIRCGWQPAEDTLPARFLRDELPDDPAQLPVERLRMLIVEYNRLRGWSDDGWLTESQLAACQALIGVVGPAQPGTGI
ncbi:MAG: aldehyde ferredoxin oxidoreductase C-terminal domain-containing protein [Pirellulales bacterium]